jgi:ABC-type dipeptide/oligopeptide/nickel transport system ATPase component
LISEVADLQRALKTVEAADLTVDKSEVVGLVGESR